MTVFVYCFAVNNDKEYYTQCVTCQEFWTFRMSFYYWNTQRRNRDILWNNICTESSCDIYGKMWSENDLEIDTLDIDFCTI